MPETLVDTQTVTANTSVEATPVQASEPKEDLVTRASKVTLDNPQKSEPTPTESIKLDQATIDKIADPVLKAAVQEAHKSMQADYTRKTQAVAEERRQFEAKIQQMKYWTPERVQTELNNPSFIQAAQEYQRINGGQQVAAQTNGNGDLTSEEFSYLTPEQQKLYQKTKQMEQTLNVVNNRLQASEVEKQDMTLKSKYANYSPQSVNDIYNGMMNGTIQATREHLWKVQDYDYAVQRAYELGRQDRKLEQGEKFNASSQPNNISVTPSSGDVPVRQPNESQSDHWHRIATNAMKKVGVIK